MLNQLHRFILFQTFISVVLCAPSSFKTNEPFDNELDVSCLEQFYDAVYKGDYNCTSNFDFLSDDQEIHQQAFTSGKSCFLEVIQGECSKAQSTYFSQNSDEIVKILTEKPADETSCGDLFYVYNGLKCSPLLKSFSYKAMTMAMAPPKKVNDTNIVGLIDLCDQIQDCMKPVCYYPEMTKVGIEKSCEIFRMTNSEFGICMTNLQKHLPKSSKYPCLEGQDFNSKDLKVGAEMLTTKKECTKEIMVDSCGEGVLEDFDKNAEISLKALEMAQQVLGAMMGGL